PEPRLVSPNEGTGLAVELSQSGRYVRYGMNQLWRLYDVMSGTVYNNTLISPDETYFVRFVPGTPSQAELTNQTYSNLVVDIYTESLIMDFAWFDDHLFTLLICADESQQSFAIHYHRVGDGNISLFTNDMRRNPLQQ